MYGLLRNVIMNGRYRLSEMVEKINTMWGESMITDGQRAELLELAQRHLNPATETPEQEELYRRLLEKYEALEARVKVLEGAKGEASGDGTAEDETVPEYVAGKWYYNGDKVTFGGKVYICTAPNGLVCVWSPSAYPTYWEESTSES